MSSWCYGLSVMGMSHCWVCRFSSCRVLRRVPYFWAAKRNDSVLGIKAIDSEHTVSLYFIDIYFHQLLYLSRKVRNPDLGGLWHWLYVWAVLCAQDSQTRALFFFVIKPQSCIWFHLNVGYFPNWRMFGISCVFIWSTLSLMYIWWLKVDSIPYLHHLHWHWAKIRILCFVLLLFV